jgi:NDP-sugar pyrophosphorylase family protein
MGEEARVGATEGHQAVVLAGGRGTRLEPYTLVFPKPLMPLDDTPILEVILTQLRRTGFTDVTLAVGHLAQLIEAFFGDGERLGVRLTYAREETPLGTAGPLASIQGLEEPFLVMNGDVLCTLDYGAFLRDHIASGATASIATCTRRSRLDFGVVETLGDGRITGYIEKPSTDYNVSMGVYAFSPSVIDLIAAGEHLDFPDLVLRLLAHDEHVRSVPFEGPWLDIGRHEDFARAQSVFGELRAEFLHEED